MITVQTLIDSGIFTLKTPGDSSRSIEKVFCCDLLSIAMSKAPESGAWVTVMGNKNTIAVASLTDIACIILAEGILFSQEDLDCAEKEGIAVFATELPIFEAALKIQEILS
ncbi:MAG: DRTGG domain-containing protein [Dorea sp.]